MRPLTGRDPRVSAYIESDPGFLPFLCGIWRWLQPLLPRYEKEGKTYLTIGIGCTGGRHRSVVIADRLAEEFAERGDYMVEVIHRDVDKPPRRA